MGAAVVATVATAGVFVFTHVLPGAVASASPGISDHIPCGYL